MTAQARQRYDDEELGRLLRELGLAGSGLAIAKERLHQIYKGYDLAWDQDANSGEQLSAAAACYALAGTLDDPRVHGEGLHDEDFWPWDRLPENDKRDKHHRRRRLAIAAALLWAELDRLSSIAASTPLTSSYR